MMDMTADMIVAEVAAATTAGDRRVIISPILRSLSDGIAGARRHTALTPHTTCEHEHEHAHEHAHEHKTRARFGGVESVVCPSRSISIMQCVTRRLRLVPKKGS
jgi:hypothetical protein